ncbi:triacylglycerol lipase [Dictyocaulus viviparus]|uniref:Triacylglycerol lipase n=1 Tax=Dictyocaulus viviparus TaxID=29172 RepID=A0A0D8XZ63_DICVI|nr:triacylglycerol lipase [Dictyocaulus viviparus]
MQFVQLLTIVGILMLDLSTTRCSSTAVESRFSDEFARRKVVPLCAATRADNPQLCLNRFFNDTTVKWIAGGMVSEYFYNAFMEVWLGGIEDDFLSASKKYNSYELWIVGHSLGGAMASLASSYVEKMKLFDGDRIKVITFGQPRTGDIDYAKAYENQIPYAFRVTHSRDIVPHIPLRSIQHYYHHKTEVFYNNNMTLASYIECDEEESIHCSDRAIDASIEDHRRYFNVAISKWGKSNCAGDPSNMN